MNDSSSRQDFAGNNAKLGRLLNIGRQPIAVRMRSQPLASYCHFRARHWLCSDSVGCPLCVAGSPRRRSWFALFDSDRGACGLLRISNTQWSQHFAGANPGMSWLTMHGDKGLSFQRHPSYDRSVVVMSVDELKREVLIIHGIAFVEGAFPSPGEVTRAIIVKAQEALS